MNYRIGVIGCGRRMSSLVDKLLSDHKDFSITAIAFSSSGKSSMFSCEEQHVKIISNVNTIANKNINPFFIFMLSFDHLLYFNFNT